MNAKAILRARLKENREKRIDSPLVRYNDLGQPVCKVCNVPVKSESLWPAHLVSKQHKEAVDLFKAHAKSTKAPSLQHDAHEAAASSASSSQDLPATLGGKLKRISSEDQEAMSKRPNMMVQEEKKVPKVIQGTQAQLPEGFFDMKRDDYPPKQDAIPLGATQVTINGQTLNQNNLQSKEASVISRSQLPDGFFDLKQMDAPSDQDNVPDKLIKDTTNAQGLPEGFFDNIDADYKARGLQPPKYDIKDELKEFQKLIQDDLHEVDLRLEEEEFDAAEDREELEVLEQQALFERVEKLRAKHHAMKHEPRKEEMKKEIAKEETEISQVIAKVLSKRPFANIKLDMGDDSLSISDEESGDEENILVDWRAKQF